MRDQSAYNRTPARRAARLRYNHSEKGAAAYARYRASSKGVRARLRDEAQRNGQSIDAQRAQLDDVFASVNAVLNQ